MTTILDPTDEREPVHRSIAPRPRELTGTVALVDISKPRGNVLLDRLAELLGERAPGVTVEHFAKPTFAKPAPDALRREIVDRARFVVEALAD